MLTLINNLKQKKRYANLQPLPIPRVVKSEL